MKIQTDYKFLCPNGTAFDQEAQTCADFGDVDCEQATLFYGSDNFDLYRIGSGFDSPKRPTPATEDESTFHLQRAESSKLYFDQSKCFQSFYERCMCAVCSVQSLIQSQIETILLEKQMKKL